MTIRLLFLNTFLLFAFTLTSIQAQSPTSAARRFNIFVKGDATLTSNETEGPVAIGGNLTSGQYQISFNNQYGVYYVNNASIGLAVRGGVKLANGSMTINGNNYVKIGNCSPSSAAANDLKVWYVDNNNAASTIRITDANGNYDSNPNITINANKNTWSPSVSTSVNPVCENVFGTGAGQIDMDAAFVTLTNRSAQLAQLADNLPIRDQNGNIMANAPMGPYLDPSVIGNNPKIIVDPNKVNVLTVSAAVWEAIKNSNIEGIPQGPQMGQASYSGNFAMIINIINFPAFAASKGNTTINFPSVGGLSDSQGSYVLYNFPDATDKVTLGGNTPIHGTIFTPQADLFKENNGDINGQIIAKSFSHTHDEVHFWPFLTSIPEPVAKKITLTATSECSDNAPYLNYTVTPNYDATGQTAKIEWLNSEGAVVQTDNSQPLNGKILFPGATVDQDGAGSGWPGWAYSAGKWVEVTDLTSTIRNAGAKIRVTVSPTEWIDVSYPLTTNTCRTSPPPPTVLPVTVVSFTAKNESCDIQLKWTISESKNFSHFVVERSNDARTFVALATVPFDANQKDYGYRDTAPYSSEVVPVKNYYYRLQQVDNDNSFEYSQIRNVEAGQCDARLAVDFYPNPTQDVLNVKSFSAVKTIEILTAGGTPVLRMSPAKNQTEVKVDVQSFTQGLYIVNIVNQEGKYASKIMKK